MNSRAKAAEREKLLTSTVTAVYLVIASGDPGRQPDRFTFDSVKACAEARKEMFEASIGTTLGIRYAVCMASRDRRWITAVPRSGVP